MNRNKTIVGVLLLLAMLCSPAMADVYNFLEDWSGEGTQPDGQWYYRKGSATNPSYATLTWSTDRWQADNQYQSIGATFMRSNGYSIWVGLRWLAPEDGTIDLEMVGMIGDGSNRADMQWKVWLNNTVLQSGTWEKDKEATLS